MDLFKILCSNTFSEPGYVSSGLLLSDVLQALTGTYPLDCRIVNPEEWNSEGEPNISFLPVISHVWGTLGFRRDRFIYSGKLYKPEDIHVSTITSRFSQSSTWTFHSLGSLARPGSGRNRICNCFVS